MDAQQLRELAATLIEKASLQDNELRFRQARIDKLTHEMAVLRRLQFAARSERLDSGQRSLLEEAIDADLQALSHELEALQPAKPEEGCKATSKRQPLPANLPRIEVRHEPEHTVCGCGCALQRIGEDVSEKLDYMPAMFHVGRHIRGKWVCSACETLIQAPVPAQVIDTSGYRSSSGCGRTSRFGHLRVAEVKWRRVNGADDSSVTR